MEMHILIVDDEPNIRIILERTLRGDGYLLDTASDGEDALRKIQQNRYDLFLLDLQMQSVSGLVVLKAIRELDADAVVIILTAHSTIESAVDALRLGAFDYLFKPTSPETIREVVREGVKHRQQAQQRARLNKQIVLLRQTLLDLEAGSTAVTQSSERFCTSGKLIIDFHHHIATLDGHLLDLTTTEFNLLTCLVKNSPQPVSPRQLMKSALEYNTNEVEARNIIKYHIHNLRKKIEPDLMKPRFIKTIRYKGYLWNDQ
jgi:DNA-binding response OmpR family regulator